VLTFSTPIRLALSENKKGVKAKQLSQMWKQEQLLNITFPHFLIALRRRFIKKNGDTYASLYEIMVSVIISNYKQIIKMLVETVDADKLIPILERMERG